MKASTDSGDDRRVHLTKEVCRVNLLYKTVGTFQLCTESYDTDIAEKRYCCCKMHCSLFAFVDFFENFIIV